MIHIVKMPSRKPSPARRRTISAESTAPDGPRPISGPRARRRAARTTQILTLAMRQVETRGLDGLTLQEIARDLDYTVPALYRYFASKDALVAELQRRVVAVLDCKLAEVDGRLKDWLAGRSRRDQERFGPLAGIAATGLFYSGLARSAPQAFGLLAVSLGDPRHLIEDAQARAVMATAQPMFDRLMSHIAGAVEAELLDPGDAADRILVFWSSLHGVAQLAKLERLAPERLDSQRLCDSLLEVLMVGWGAEPGRVKEVIGALRSAGLAHTTVVADDLARIAAIDTPVSA
jgi:AcrR family transcriptional regulator